MVFARCTVFLSANYCGQGVTLLENEGVMKWCFLQKKICQTPFINLSVEYDLDERQRFVGDSQGAFSTSVGAVVESNLVHLHSK